MITTTIATLMLLLSLISASPPSAVCSTDMDCREYAIAHGIDSDGGPYE